MNDFDFLFGEWNVHHRKVTDTLDPECTEWVEFDGLCEARPVLDGAGNVDTVSATLPGGQAFEGMSLRLYDPAADRWRIWWSSTTRPGKLDPPVEGRFTDGTGIFLGDDTIGGRPTLVRYRWSAITATSARWEQDFSYDAGATWSPVNWIMTFTRRDSQATATPTLAAELSPSPAQP
ncbi:hypothetical protein OHA21_11730 [Actinoplanes sp. NBC_00393]|uniref:hypothetical protein n=1 Tax=Actinoplanes sp. NBC_00393 TaxID=2975953 RepID=UPI002E1B2CAA